MKVLCSLSPKYPEIYVCVCVWEGVLHVYNHAFFGRSPTSSQTLELDSAFWTVPSVPRKLVLALLDAALRTNLQAFGVGKISL